MGADQPLPNDGQNIVGINLPHMVFQPLEGQVQYKTDDIVPVYWYHYTPDALVVLESSPIKTFQDFIKAAKADPGKLSLGGSGLNSANHAANERMNAAFGVKTTYIPFKGTGDMTASVLGGHVDGAMTYTAFAVNNKGKVRALAVAMDKRHPLLPDTPTFKELGVDWVDGAYRGIAMPKSTTPVWPGLMIQEPSPVSVAVPPENRAWVGGVPLTNQSVSDLKSNVSVAATGGGGGETEPP